VVKWWNYNLRVQLACEWASNFVVLYPCGMICVHAKSSLDENLLDISNRPKDTHVTRQREPVHSGSGPWWEAVQIKAELGLGRISSGGFGGESMGLFRYLLLENSTKALFFFLYWLNSIREAQIPKSNQRCSRYGPEGDLSSFARIADQSVVWFLCSTFRWIEQ